MGEVCQHSSHEVMVKRPQVQQIEMIWQQQGFRLRGTTATREEKHDDIQLIFKSRQFMEHYIQDASCRYQEQKLRFQVWTR